MFKDDYSYYFLIKYKFSYLTTNPMTLGVTIDTLMANKDKFEISENEDAIQKFNNLKSYSVVVPNLDNQLYHTILFKNNEEHYLLIGINVKMFNKLNKKELVIDNYDFLFFLIYIGRKYLIAHQKKIKNNNAKAKAKAKPVVQQQNIIFDELDEKYNDYSDYDDNINYENAMYDQYGNQTYQSTKEYQTLVDLIMKKDYSKYKINNKKFDGLKLDIDLFDYQKRTISWMYEHEKHPKKYNYKEPDEISIGNYNVSINKQKISDKDNMCLRIKGGGLIDEMGLGKTIQITVLSYINRSEEYEIDHDNKILKSKATLILCPNTLGGQWFREIEKVFKKKPKILKLFTKVNFDKITLEEILDADYILVSFNFLQNTSILSSFVNKQYYNKINYLSKCTNYKNEYLKKIFKAAKKSNEYLDSVNVHLAAITWHRIVIDEFHDLYKETKFKYINDFLKITNAKYKWLMSGTPFENVTSLSWILNYLNNSIVIDNVNNIPLSKGIVSYLIKDGFVRNSKSSIDNEVNLPKITQKTIWLKFTATERMIYNAYLANSYHNKDDIFLRKLCCHPTLAEELKFLDNYNTLEEIEKKMLKHYKTQYKKSKTRMINTQKKLLIMKKRLNRLHKKAKGIESDSDSDNDSSILNTEDDDKEDNNDKIELIKVDDVIEFMKPDDIKDKELALKIITIQNTIVTIREKLKEVTKVYEGCQTTYNFYNNVMEKIRNVGDNTDNCGICLDEIPEHDMAVTVCGHLFCYSELVDCIMTTPKCPYCNKQLSKQDCYHISYQKKDKIKKKKSLEDKVGTKLAKLIEYLQEIDDHVVLFSQWDDLLKNVGTVLKEYNINNIFCKGSVFQRDKAINQFNTNPKTRVIMLSSENAASGTNLTKASKVILLDPVYGDKDYRLNIENQAIGRIHRIGQKKDVEVIRFLIKDTIEEDIYESNK